MMRNIVSIHTLVDSVPSEECMINEEHAVVGPSGRVGTRIHCVLDGALYYVTNTGVQALYLDTDELVDVPPLPTGSPDPLTLFSMDGHVVVLQYFRDA
ncbi:hypothetical protein KIPB_017075, partial [Kipferlia bialata]|eukprot:g17075.t1